ncbi:MAG: hypothetical protein AB7O52_12440 [Planctomycetota bacterium]
MQAPQDFIVVHHAASVGEAELVVAVLLNAGLSAFVESSGSPYPGLDETPFDAKSGVAGCEVLVPRAEENRARQALIDARESPLAEDEGELPAP